AMTAGPRPPAPPPPHPPSRRQAIRSQTPTARPEPTAEAKNSTAAITITGTRPKRLARPPVNQAPTAQPIRAEETAKPVSPAPSENSSDRAFTAPLITEVAKPNRNPPTAAAIEMPMTLGFSAAEPPLGESGEEPPGEGRSAEEDM